CLTCMVNQSNALNCLRRHAQAITVARTVIERCKARRLEAAVLSFAYLHVVVALTAFDLLAEARAAASEALPSWRRNGLLVFFCDHLAFLAAKEGRLDDAARLSGANEAYCKRNGIIVRSTNVQRVLAELKIRFDEGGLAGDDLERLMNEGAALDGDALVA